MLHMSTTAPGITVVNNDIKIDPLTVKNSIKEVTTKNCTPDVKNNRKQHQQHHRSSIPLASIQNYPSNTTLSPPSTPLPYVGHNHSFSSSQQSIQSISSDQLLDHSHLKPGQNASLLSYNKTINMYRENVKKTNNMEVQCDFAIFLVEASKRLQLQKEETSTNSTGSTSDRSISSSNQNEQNEHHAYTLEAEKLLKQVAMRGHSESQYYLANMYAAGLLNKARKPDFDKAFPLFAQSAKHHHPDAAYRTAKCYEDGLGTTKNKAKAVQYYRKAATLNHPGAMYRLGLAEMKGELTLSRNIRDGHKWLKRSAEAATAQYPHALHELALLHEKGVESVIFPDLKYAVSLYHEAAVLGYAPAAHRLGECYEFGKLGCSIDPGLSVQYYNIAADQHHPESCFALTAWYLVGIPQLLPQSDEQAYAWAIRAAQCGLPRAEYAVGYFTEMGIGTEKNEQLAMQWYQKAADHGEKRAIQRLQPSVPHTNKPVPSVNNSKRMSFMSISSISRSSNSKRSSNSSFLQRATSFLRKPSHVKS